jgi:hypothetical protein
MRSTTGNSHFSHRGNPLHNKHDAISRTSEPTSENSVKAKFVRNVNYDVGLIKASRKAEADF